MQGFGTTFDNSSSLNIYQVETMFRLSGCIVSCMIQYAMAEKVQNFEPTLTWLHVQVPVLESHKIPEGPFRVFRGLTDEPMVANVACGHHFSGAAANLKALI